MYYFLGIVKKDDLAEGYIEPSYILCQSHGTSTKRSGFRIIHVGGGFEKMNKVLVKTIHGNENIIAFMSNFRTRHHMHGSKKIEHEYTKKYYPEGVLFYFPCNIYGERCGTPIFIKKVPDVKTSSDQGFQELKQAAERKIYLNELFSKEPKHESIPFSSVKPILYQDKRSKRK